MSTLIIAIALLQTPDPTVAVILHDRTVIMRRSEAEARLRGASDPALTAALEIALGTAIDNKVDGERLTKQERERFRWHRRPLQKQP